MAARSAAVSSAEPAAWGVMGFIPIVGGCEREIRTAKWILGWAGCEVYTRSWTARDNDLSQDVAT